MYLSVLPIVTNFSPSQMQRNYKTKNFKDQQDKDKNDWRAGKWKHLASSPLNAVEQRSLSKSASKSKVFD